MKLHSERHLGDPARRYQKSLDWQAVETSCCGNELLLLVLQDTPAAAAAARLSADIDRCFI